MANWQSTIDLADLWEKYDRDNITLPLVIQTTLERCKQNRFYPLFKHNVEAMQEALDWFNESPEIEGNFDYLETRFDEFMDNLYDFGDFQYRIWVKTQQ